MDALEAILTRKSIRSYLADPLTDDQIETILQAGEAAPTALGKFDALQVCVVLDPSTLEEISDKIEKETGRKGTLYGAPALFVICFDRTAPTADFAQLNCACVADNMLLAAHAQGLGAVIQMASAGVIKSDMDLRDKVSLPDNFDPVLSVCVGYPAKDAAAAEKKTRSIVTTTDLGL